MTYSEVGALLPVTHRTRTEDLPGEVSKCGTSVQEELKSDANRIIVGQWAALGCEPLPRQARIQRLGWFGAPSLIPLPIHLPRSAIVSAGT